MRQCCVILGQSLPLKVTPTLKSRKATTAPPQFLESFYSKTNFNPRIHFSNNALFLSLARHCASSGAAIHKPSLESTFEKVDSRLSIASISLWLLRLGAFLCHLLHFCDKGF
ncbi:hypothetical protein [Helicobacter canis]|uniref:hypothetical protein n=1 Tax=Helicobacter canis TaxID=29419 RepID=UPI0011C03496|nr:hypothetical protein [Helicobacter canis]